MAGTGFQRTENQVNLMRALLRRVLPAEVRDGIIGDLEERLQQDRSRWAYRKRAAGLIARFAVERVRDEIRSVAGLRFSMLDVRLALRMLVRYPVLTTVGGFGLSLAIALGAAVFAFITIAMYPTIPLPEVDRVVAVRLVDAEANGPELRASFDFLQWRHDASTLKAIGASRMLSRNLTTADGRLESVAFAEVTASIFDVLALRPVKGRFLIADDERADAPGALVISHALWQSRFGGSESAIGQAVTIGDVPATVVGIMPKGMGFPSNQDAWMPLRWPVSSPAPKTGPEIRVWGRIADGRRLEEVAAEFATLGARRRAAYPREYAHVEPQILTITEASTIRGPEAIVLQAGNVFVVLLLVLVSGNVALLMFARAATRESEILVRTALGASRRRVVLQFFTEALALGTVAAIIGLWGARRGLVWAMQMLVTGANDGSPLPYWIVPELPPASILYAVFLTLLSAFITGVLPALKVTRSLSGRLRASTAGSGGLKFGGVWTAVIVTQVALTVLFPVSSFFVKRDGVQVEKTDIGVSPDRILHVGLRADRDQTEADFGSAVARIRETLSTTPGVRGATLASWLPLMAHSLVTIDVEGETFAHKEFGDDEFRISQAAVDPSFFSTFTAPPLAGRLFGPSDTLHPNQFVIVNESFVKRLLKGRNPIGRRVRFSEAEEGQGAPLDKEPWREIIGVVRDLGMGFEPGIAVSGVYSPMAPGSRRSYTMAARLDGDPMAIAPAVRAMVRDISPATRITALAPLRAVTDGEMATVTFWFRMTLGLSLAALALSLTGIYAVMSFTVSRRTREIGIRMALGSRPARVVFAVLRKPLMQITTGVFAGALLSGTLVYLVYESSLSSTQVAAFLGYVLLMLVVCLLACFVPTRRAMNIDPIEALRAD